MGKEERGKKDKASRRRGRCKEEIISGRRREFERKKRKKGIRKVHEERGKKVFEARKQRTRLREAMKGGEWREREKRTGRGREGTGERRRGESGEEIEEWREERGETRYKRGERRR